MACLHTSTLRLEECIIYTPAALFTEIINLPSNFIYFSNPKDTSSAIFLFRSPIRPFRFPNIITLWQLLTSIQSPNIILKFSHHSSVTTTQILTFTIFNLTISALVLTQSKLVKLCTSHSSKSQLLSLPLHLFHSNTHTFHPTPLILTVAFHLCFNHSKQIKLTF